MYCNKCGNELSDNVKFCAKCGAPVGKVKKPVNKKVIFGGIIVIVILAVILIIPKGRKSGFKTPEAACETFYNGFVTKNFDLMLEAYTDFLIEYNGGADATKKSMEADYRSLYIDNYISEGYVITYEAVGSTMLNEKERLALEQDINNMYGIEEKLQAAAFVNYDTIYELAGIETTFPFVGGYAVKYGGKWYYINMYSSSR